MCAAHLIVHYFRRAVPGRDAKPAPAPKLGGIRQSITSSVRGRGVTSNGEKGGTWIVRRSPICGSGTEPGYVHRNISVGMNVENRKRKSEKGKKVIERK